MRHTEKTKFGVYCDSFSCSAYKILQKAEDGFKRSSVAGVRYDITKPMLYCQAKKEIPTTTKEMPIIVGADNRSPRKKDARIAAQM